MKKELLLLTIVSLLIGGTLFTSISFAKEEKERNENGKPTLYVSNDDNESDDEDRNENSTSTDITSTSTATSTDDNNDDEKSFKNHGQNVSTYVKSLLDVADRNNNGIGEKIRVFTREQSTSTEVIVDSLDKIENRSKFKTFLIGSDYKNIGKIRSEIAQTQNRLSQLNRELEKMATSTDKTNIINDIAALESEQTRLENFINSNESKFSLFGWFVKLFNK